MRALLRSEAFKKINQYFCVLVLYACKRLFQLVPPLPRSQTALLQP